jgi:hypothetical protein
MYHAVPVEAAEGAYMSKLDQLDAFIHAVHQRREELEKHKDRLLKALESCDKAIATVDKAIEVSAELREKIGPDLMEILKDIEFPVLPQLVEPTKEEGTLSPQEVAERAKDVILEAGRPMKRGELVRALAARNVPLAGKDKNKNLGTILWRRSHQFVNLGTLGYWVKGVPLAGVYDPEK